MRYLVRSVSTIAMLLSASAMTASAQAPLGTAFTYSGGLATAGAPANGAFDVRFRLFDSVSGGSQVGPTLCLDNLSVTNGQLAATLDFGAVFNGQRRFLEIEVRADSGLDCSDASGYTLLSPRQELTATPHALFASSAGTATSAGNALSLGGQPSSFFTNAGNLTGTLADARLSANVARLNANQTFSGALTLSNPANTVSGTFTGNGAALTNLTGTNIALGTIARDRLATDVERVLGLWTPGFAPLDAVAWGNNNSGQASVPTPPAGLTYTAVAAGQWHSLALRSDGVIVGWGRNDAGLGQLNIPALPAGLRYTAVASGENHGFGLRSDGTLVGWGNNGVGQTNVPVLPAGLTYTAVAAGSNHSLALRSDGILVGFGFPGSEQLNIPALPAGLTYTAVACGTVHSLALRSNGTLVAFGSNTFGQLNIPALPAGVTYTAVAAGTRHSVALRSNGTIIAWGDTLTDTQNVPALPAGLTYVSVTSGGEFVLARRSDGSVVAWGRFENGQLNIPALPAGLSYTSLAAGGFHGVAVRSGAAAIASAPIYGSGAGLTNINASGLSGTLPASVLTGVSGAGLTNLSGTNIATGTIARDRMAGDVERVLSQWTPVAAPSGAIGWGSNVIGQTNIPALPAGVSYTALAAGGSHSVGLRSDGTIIAWGNPNDGRTTVPALPAGVTYTGVAAGSLHSVALRSNGTVVAWGANFQGQLGVPALPAGLTYTAVASGEIHSLALRSDGTIATWGDSADGKLTVPALPAGMRYTAIAGGTRHSFALRSDGTVVAWGSNADNQLNIPALPAGTTYTAVASAGLNSVMLRSDGRIIICGNNSFSQLTVPALPAGLTYTAVAGNLYQFIALRSDGAAIAWGDTSTGQSTVPTPPAGVLYSAVAAGPTHSLALRQSPTVVASGTIVGSGAGLTNLSAASITTGTLAAAQIPSLDASKITTGIIPNARTTGTNINAGNMLVLRDAAGSFSAGVITATLSGTASNASALGGQPASFYTSAASITSGTIDIARLPTNLARTDVNTTFNGAANSFIGALGVGTGGPTNTLDVNGRLTVRGGTIQNGTIPVSGTSDMGLYSAQGWMRFVTNNTQFSWFTDGGSISAGGTPRMTLSNVGNLTVTGSLAKGGGSFKIDHPLDPENKYLYHSFVESPDMMNIYNGNITTDDRGFATITLPDYFEALNRDFRYQLTVVGQFAQAIVSDKVKANRFTIQTDKPNVEVSWQVTGIRQDAWANKNRIPNAIDKPEGEKGKLLHPEAFGTR